MSKYIMFNEYVTALRQTILELLETNNMTQLELAKS